MPEPNPSLHGISTSLARRQLLSLLDRFISLLSVAFIQNFLTVDVHVPSDYIAPDVPYVPKVPKKNWPRL